jgi:hypothetical protein
MQPLLRTRDCVRNANSSTWIRASQRHSSSTSQPEKAAPNAGMACTVYGNAWEPLYYENAYLVHHFHDRLSLPSGCSLCSFFRTMRLHGDSYRSSKLLAFCSSENRLFCPPRWKNCWSRQQFKHTVFMAVLPDFDTIPLNGYGEYWLERDIATVGTIYRLSPSEPHYPNTILRARELGEKADFSIIQEWLSVCGLHHDCGCSPRKPDQRMLRGFRLVNCTKDPPVVESRPWRAKYVALSYV